MWKDQSERDTPCSIMMLQAERIAFMVGSSFIWMLVKIHWSLGVTNLWYNANQGKYMLLSCNVARPGREGHFLFNNDVADRKSAAMVGSSFIWILVKRHCHLNSLKPNKCLSSKTKSTGWPKKMLHKDSWLKSVLEVRFYFSAGVLESEN